MNISYTLYLNATKKSEKRLYNINLNSITTVPIIVSCNCNNIHLYSLLRCLLIDRTGGDRSAVSHCHSVALQRSVRPVGAVPVLARNVRQLVSVRPEVLQGQVAAKRDRLQFQQQHSVWHQDVPQVHALPVLRAREAAMPVGRLTAALLANAQQLVAG